MVGSCKTAVGSGLASLLLPKSQQLEWFPTSFANGWTEMNRKAPEGLISGAFRLPLRTIHFILPTGIIAYAFWCFKYSRMSNLAIQTATQNVIHWFLLEI